jgi:Kef-type K+ transport system membrane component KefB
METSLIIFICALLILAYLFDISSALTKIPSVILLLLLGWLVKQATIFLNLTVPDLNPVLPALGTIGLILIVLEGAIELEINKGKARIINKAFFLALIPLLLIAFIIATVLYSIELVDYKTALLNAVPFCVISSAIAIPSVRSLSHQKRELVIYESSFSDIAGVLFFNFIALNGVFDGQTFLHFGYQMLIIIAISFASVLILSFLLGHISHHVTYTPIILLIILIYAITKQYHLPGLLFILVFGLFLGNLHKFSYSNWFRFFRPSKLEKEVAKFKDITFEVTFLVRALFFLLFGYLMETSELLSLDSLPWAAGIVALIFLVRWSMLILFRLPVATLLFVAPRGLITVLLFLSILPEQSIPLINKSLIIQTIILSVLVMMFGLMFTDKKPKPEPETEPEIAEVKTPLPG